MQKFALVVAIFAACSHAPSIGPDDAASDGSTVDVIVTTDASADAGDGGTIAPGDTNLAGTRLRLVVMKGADGSQQFWGFFDAQQNVMCSWQKASDTQIRCLPSTGDGGQPTNWVLGTVTTL